MNFSEITAFVHPIDFLWLCVVICLKVFLNFLFDFVIESLLLE